MYTYKIYLVKYFFVRNKSSSKKFLFRSENKTMRQSEDLTSEDSVNNFVN